MAKDFCQYYNINGFRGGKIQYGLYYKNNLICVAIFKKYKQNYECVRLVFKTGIEIIGGWKKIQKHFGKRFLHYVNLNYFQGENKTGIGYRIMIKGKILHRGALQLKTGLLKYCKTIDSNLSDFQNCLNNGDDIKKYLENEYDGWTKIDHTSNWDDEDIGSPYSPRILTTTWEVALFDKEKYKPIKRLISVNGDWTDKQLEFIANLTKNGNNLAKWELDERKFRDVFPDNTDYPTEEEYKKSIERNKIKLEKKNIEDDDNQQTLWDEERPRLEKKNKLWYALTKLANSGGNFDAHFIPEWKGAIEIASKVERKPDRDIFGNWRKEDWLLAKKYLSEYLDNLEN